MRKFNNTFTLIGNVRSDLNLVVLKDSKLTNISLCTNNEYLNKQGERVINSTWHKITLWGKDAENAVKYIQKGDKVLFEGSITNQDVEISKKKDGKFIKTNYPSFNVSFFRILSQKK